MSLLPKTHRPIRARSNKPTVNPNVITNFTPRTKRATKVRKEPLPFSIIDLALQVIGCTALACIGFLVFQSQTVNQNSSSAQSQEVRLVTNFQSQDPGFNASSDSKLPELAVQEIAQSNPIDLTSQTSFDSQTQTLQTTANTLQPVNQGSQSSSKSSSSLYIVKQNDSLFSISIRFKVSLKSLMLANDLDEASILQVGQEIQIPRS